MSRILIIEDEEAIADLEKDYLELSGFEVEICNRGDTGLTRALNEEFDLIILDLMLPEVDGFDICRQVRQEKNTPIIMVSAKKDDIDKIRGLGLGADDYMTKPFSPSELVARVKAHMDRYNRLIGSNVRKNDIVEIRGIKIDKTARRVFVNGEEKIFTTKEFDLLTFLAEHPNHVYTKEELFECADAAYSQTKFGAEPVPLRKVNESTDVLELWHGPTSAFKDMALQILPHLLTKAIAKTGESNKVVILVATSGDTGKAALEGFANVKDTEIIVFYPDDGVSAIQKRQMLTQAGDNVRVIGIQGNFDDAQRGVKELFGDTALEEELQRKGYVFSSANSINWGRLVPQIVYYFSAYSDAVANGRIKAGEKINFAVPTGNFGDILAGYYAKLMGLPVAKFICASNSNNVLSDFINTGIYDRRREFYKTVSPSMDILVSSNLERLLYSITEDDAAKVSEWMQQLTANGTYNVGEKVNNRILEEFFGAWVDELETKETIGRVFNDNEYLMDPHTAVAWRACEKYRLVSSDDTYCIVLSTASPYKFSDVVLEAAGSEEDAKLEPFDGLRKLHALSGLPIPEPMLAMEKMPILHQEVIESADMKKAVETALKL